MVFWVVIAFISGSLPMSVWVGRLALGVDIRDYGDGNPGATNVFRAGGKGWGMVAILLDGFKGAIPVWVATLGYGVDGWWVTAVALAPILGHAYSPFLRFNGGKALAVTFGVWAGLSFYVVPVIMGVLFALFLRWVTAEGWAVMLGVFFLLPFILLINPDPVWLSVWGGTLIILAVTHRADLRQRP